MRVSPSPIHTQYSILNDARRILFVKNLTYALDPSSLFALFGKFGPIRQIRQGTSPSTKGTAFVVYDEIADAKQACDKLNGYNFMNRYLVVLYHQPEKMAGKSAVAAGEAGKADLEERKERLERVKKEHSID